MNETNLKSFIEAHLQKPENNAPFVLENPHTLELNIKGIVWAKVSSMISYQGYIEFTRERTLNRGWNQFLLGRFTSEGVRLMKIHGAGRVYLADFGKRVQILKLNNESIIVNGNDILAFESTIQSKITMMKSFGAAFASGLFNIHLKGSGYVAITTHHTPLALVTTPAKAIYTDPQATVAWSPDLNVEIHTDFQLKTFFGRGSGESLQLKFTGQGWVLVQPYEEHYLVK